MLWAFQLTRLMRGVTKSNKYVYKDSTISTHTPHARRDRCRGHGRSVSHRFQLTRLMRGVTANKRLKYA